MHLAHLMMLFSNIMESNGANEYWEKKVERKKLAAEIHKIHYARSTELMRHEWE